MASEKMAQKLEEQAKAQLQKAAEIRRQIAEKQADQEKRAMVRQQKMWGRRPQDTHRKILLGVAALAFLKELSPPERNAFAKKLLAKLDERDRATLLQQPEFQSF
jgi:hypothetical protein